MELAKVVSIVFLFLTAAFVYCQTDSSYYLEVYPPVNLTGNLTNHLFFALIMSYGTVYNGSGVIVGVKVALDRINSSPDILPNHILHYTLTDSQVS